MSFVSFSHFIRHSASTLLDINVINTETQAVTVNFEYFGEEIKLFRWDFFIVWASDLQSEQNKNV